MTSNIEIKWHRETDSNGMEGTPYLQTFHNIEIDEIKLDGINVEMPETYEDWIRCRLMENNPREEKPHND